MIKKGDIITIKPEWRDARNARFTWVARNDEEHGRVGISAVELAYMDVWPVQTVRSRRQLGELRANQKTPSVDSPGPPAAITQLVTCRGTSIIEPTGRVPSDNRGDDLSRLRRDNPRFWVYRHHQSVRHRT